jgi:uncharacterized protein YndB with AHSA1/START domain
MDWSQYRFRSAWHLDAEPDAVYRVLERPDHYPTWWPQIREVRQTDDTSGLLRFRSVLPYDLVVRAISVRQDPEARVLEAAMTGDLEGWFRWTIGPGMPGGPGSTGTPGRAGTHLLYEQEVVVRKPLMRLLAVPCRPLFLANHALMMRGGRLGLLARLARDAGSAAGHVV